MHSSIWPIDGTLSGASTLGQSRYGSDSNERILSIPQSSSITGVWPSDCLMSYSGHLLVRGVLHICVIYSQYILQLEQTGPSMIEENEFRMGTFIDSTHMNLVPFELISFSCNPLVVPFQQLLEGPMEVFLYERINDLCHSLFHLNCLIMTASKLRE